MEIFRAEIAPLLIAEQQLLREKGKQENPINMEELTEVNLYDLTPLDAKMWYQANNGLVTIAEFKEYDKDVQASSKFSRKALMAFIGNKLSPQFLKEEIKMEQEKYK